MSKQYKGTEESSTLYISRFVKYWLGLLIIVFYLTTITFHKVNSASFNVDNQFKRYQSNLDKLGSSEIGQKITIKTSSGLSGHLIVDEKLKDKLHKTKSESQVQSSSFNNPELLKKLQKNF